MDDGSHSQADRGAAPEAPAASAVSPTWSDRLVAVVVVVALIGCVAAIFPTAAVLLVGGWDIAMEAIAAFTRR